MKKPISMRIEDFRRAIVDAVNDSELPIHLCSYILRDTLAEIIHAQKVTDEREKQEYLAKETEENG